MESFYQATHKNGMSITTVVASDEHEARKEITKTLRGRPGGRDKAFRKWLKDGARVRCLG